MLTVSTFTDVFSDIAPTRVRPVRPRWLRRGPRGSNADGAAGHIVHQITIRGGSMGDMEGGQRTDRAATMPPLHKAKAVCRNVTRKWADGFRHGQCIAERWTKPSAAAFIEPSLYQQIDNAYSDRSRSRSRNFRNTSRLGSKRATWS